MAHNIQILENGQGCFVENVGERVLAEDGTFRYMPNRVTCAWHGLGTTFQEALTIDDAMEACKANFEVAKQPVIALTPELVEAMNNGEFINAAKLRNSLIGNTNCNMRTDTNQVLGICSDSYSIIQNIDAFHFLANICGMEDNAPVIETMGVLEDGTSFASIRMKNVYSLGKNDDVDLYLVVKNSFSTKEALSVCVGNQRVVCQNTMNMAFANAQSKLFIRHTRYANNRLADIENAAKTLKFYEIYKEAFAENMERLKSIKLTDKQCEQIICRTLMGDDVWKVYVNSNYNRLADDLSTRTKNNIENALNVLHGGIGQRECADQGTGLWLYNGITSLYNNHTKYKSEEKRFNSIFGGTADANQQKAFDLIMKVA